MAKRFLATVLLMGALASAQNVPPASKPRGVVIPPGQNRSGFSVEIVPSADSSNLRILSPEHGVMELGAVSANGNSNPAAKVRKTTKSMIVTFEFALRVTGEPGAKNQPVTINGFLTHAATVQRFRLDGQPLSAAPIAIARNVAAGTITRHRLEIEIPFSSTEADSNVNVSLGFTVSTD